MEPLSIARRTPNTSSKGPLRCAIVSALVSSIYAAHGAMAQGGDDRRATALEEVTITAQKREESLMDAPISIMALSPNMLEDKGIFGIRDLMTGSVPSLRVLPLTGRASAVQISMRGIESGDPTQISQDPAVGIYIDGVYLGRVQGLGMDLLDIERMEVLRGPQGTLFGRNAVGGALNIVSRRPTGEFGLTQRVGVGNFGQREARTNLNLPAIGDVSIKADALYNIRDGWVDNPFNEDNRDFDYNYQQRQGFRVAALWQPTDTLDVQYAYDRSRDRSTSGYPHLASFIDDRPQSPLITEETSRVSRARIGSPLRPSVGEVSGHSLDITYEINDNLRLRSITAYRDLKQTQQDQWAGSFFGLNFGGIGLTGRLSLAEVEQDQFSQEIQLIGNTDRLEYVFGAFYFEEDGEDSADTAITQRFVDGGTDVVTLDPQIISPSRASVVSAESRALFGQVTWTPPILDDRLSITGGLRYTDDKRNGQLTSIGGRAPDPAQTFSFASDRVDPALTLAYAFGDNTNTYLRWSNAYRAGGANSRSTVYNSFGEEEVEAWEIGLKTEFWDRRARLNVAAFHSVYSDRQFLFSSPADPSVTETINTPEDVEIDGIEVDFQVRPVAGLDLALNYAYTTLDFPVLRNPFPPNPLIQPQGGGQTPKHAASASATYSFEPGRYGRARANVDVTYSDGFFTPEKTPSYTIVNTRLTLDQIPVNLFGGQNIEASLWARNLFDEEWIFFRFPLDAPGFVGANMEFYGMPRTYGAEITLRF